MYCLLLVSRWLTTNTISHENCLQADNRDSRNSGPTQLLELEKMYNPEVIKSYPASVQKQAAEVKPYFQESNY